MEVGAATAMLVGRMEEAGEATVGEWLDLEGVDPTVEMGEDEAVGRAGVAVKEWGLLAVRVTLEDERGGV